MFEVITGLTAGEYVRRRRLSLAAMELASGDAKIIDVALRYGYDSPDAFAKAFRKMFGCTPTEARRPGARLRSYPPITFSITLKGAHAMEYRIETKPAFQPDRCVAPHHGQGRPEPSGRSPPCGSAA